MLMIVIGRAAQFLLMLAMLRIATTVLSPTEMGKIAIMTSMVAFVSLFLVNPVGMYVNRQLHRWNSEGRITRNIGCHYLYILIVAIVSMFVLGLSNTYGILNTHLSSYFVMAFVFLTIFFNTVNQTAIPSLNMLGFRGWFTLLSIATVFSGILFAVFFVKIFNAQSEYWLLGILMGQILFAMIGSWIFYMKTVGNRAATVRECSPAPSAMKHSLTVKAQTREYLSKSKTILHFSWPIAIAVGLTWFQSQSYRFFIENSFGLAALGLFAAGYGISAGIIAGFESVFATWFQPLFYEKISIGDEKSRSMAWNSYAKAIIPSLLLVSFTLTALSSKLTTLMLAPAFQSAAKYVVWGALIETFRVIVNVYSMVAHAEQDTKILIMPNLIGAIVSVSLMYCLIPLLGLVGVGLALAFAGLVVTVFLHLRIKRRVPIIIPYREMLHAVGFGLMIWGLNYYCGSFWNMNQTLTMDLVTIAFVGLFFLMAEYFLLRITVLSFVSNANE